jgi:hypothetical protein
MSSKEMPSSAGEIKKLEEADQEKRKEEGERKLEELYHGYGKMDSQEILNAVLEIHFSFGIPKESSAFGGTVFRRIIAWVSNDKNLTDEQVGTLVDILSWKEFEATKDFDDNNLVLSTGEEILSAIEQHPNPSYIPNLEKYNEYLERQDTDTTGEIFLLKLSMQKKWVQRLISLCQK